MATLVAVDARADAVAQVVLRLQGHNGGAVRAVVATADTVWMGEGIGVTEIEVDVDDLRRSRAVRHLVLGVNADVFGLHWLDDFLYVGAADGLYIVDLEADDGPAVVGHYVTPGTVRAISSYRPSSGGPTLLLLSDDRVGVLIAEVEGPTIRVTRAMPSSGGARSAAAVLDHLALVPGDDLYVLSLANPRAPSQIGLLKTRGQVRGLVVGEASAGLVYVSDSTEGLLAVDITDPVRPVVVGRLADAPVGALHRTGQVLLVVDNGIHLVEIDPEDPTRLSYVAVYSKLNGTRDMALSGTLLAAARGDYLTLAGFRSENPRLEPEILREVHATSPLRQLALIGDYVYVVRGKYGLNVVRVEDPTQAETVASYVPPWGTYGIRAHEGFAYVSTDRGFEVWNVQTPGAPFPVGNGPADWEPTRWIAAAERRLVATTRERLYVAELSGDEPPRVLSEFEYSEDPLWPADAVPQGVALYGEPVAFIAAGAAGLLVLDLNEALWPRVHSVVALPGGREAVAVAVAAAATDDDILAVGTRDGVVFYDLEVPQDPQLLGGHSAGYEVRNMAFEGHRLYVASDLEGLLVLEVSDPRNPQLVGRFSAAYPISDVVAAGGRAYAAGAGLLVLSVDPPPDVTPSAPPTPVTPTPITPAPTAPPVVPTATTQPSPTSTATPADTPTPAPAGIYVPILEQWRKR